jgi:hypothetical protein
MFEPVRNVAAEHCQPLRAGHQLEIALQTSTRVNPALMSGSPFAPPTPSKPFARPFCAYPQTAKYEGAGDGADAANWECVAR